MDIEELAIFLGFRSEMQKVMAERGIRTLERAFDPITV